MRLSSIDIGTNTILMLIADILRDGSLTVIKDEHTIARLGKGVDEHGVIQQETFTRVLETLSGLKNISDSYKSDLIVACGTSALRDATNRQELLDFINSQLGINIRILDGKEEAQLTYLGAISEYVQHSITDNFAVLDIGGGSTELVIGNGLTITSATSIDIGSVRLTERILKTSPPDTIALENARQLVQKQLHQITLLPTNTKLIGVAGTLTTLAAIELRLPSFDSVKINRHILSLQSIGTIFQELRPLTLNELRSYPQIHPSRADILLAGVIILKEMLQRVGFSEITVSDRGLRYGFLIQTAQTLFTTSFHEPGT